MSDDDDDEIFLEDYINLLIVRFTFTAHAFISDDSVAGK